METGNLIRLIYYSELELSMSESDLDNIINQSRQNNRENEVTGILFLVEQILFKFWKDQNQ